MTDIEQVLQRALALGEDGDWEGMATKLAEALQDDPDEPYLLCWLGVAEQELGNDGSAYEYFRRCIAAEPLDPHLLAVAGAGLAAFDDPDAEAALRAAALSAPELPVTQLQYGAYLARAGLSEEALKHLRAAVELAPDDPTVHGELGVALALSGDLEAAARSVEEGLVLAPEDDWSRVIYGLLLLELGRLEEAAEELVRAAEDRGDDPEADVLAALAAAAVGWEDAAEDALARAGFTAEAADASMIQEAEDRIRTGPDAARTFLRDAIGPSVLRERLSEPL